MPTSYVRVTDDLLQQMISIYKNASPTHEVGDFAIYLVLEELKRYRDAESDRKEEQS